MLYDPATAHHLKPWLVRTLEPICDAEPGALADYILALLKHNVPESEMRKELEIQLDEFLEKECKSFSDTLFTALRTKSYIPYASSPPSSFNSKPLDSGIPIPFDGMAPERSLKRTHDSDDRDDRPSKGPRLSTEGRYGGRPDGRSWGQKHTGGNYGDNSFGAGPSSEGRRQHGYHPPDQRRGICRDYHNNGYCARGIHCKYSHGEDAVVPNPFFMGGPQVPGGMPFLPMFPGLVPFAAAAAAAAYDPRESRMDMRPMSNNRSHSRPAVMSRMPEDGSQITHMSGELPVIQDLTPTIPQEPEDDGSTKQAPNGPEASSTPNVPFENGFNGMPYPINGQFFQPQNTQEDTEMGNPEGGQGQNGSGFRGRRGTGRGRSFGDAQKLRPERRGDKTLVVEKIPEDKLRMEHLNEWFSKFGTVTNVAIDRSGGKALVSFSTHDEAHAAWKSEDAVFNNRFVKIFWHRPMEGHGLVGARALAASAPLVANIAAKATQPSGPATPSSSTATPPAPIKKSTSSTASALAAKQQLLEQQIAEQKQLMASLESASSAEEKKGIMARLRKLGEEMKKPSTSSLSTTATPTATTTAKRTKTPDVSEHEKKELEKLDQELEGRGVDAKGSTSTEPEEDSTEALKAKLAKLKAEVSLSFIFCPSHLRQAASLGISETPPTYPAYAGGFRPYRGRGRGAPRGYYRGAIRGGGPPRGSMKLDNRPKKLLVKGVTDESVQALKGWYDIGGQVDSFEAQEDGKVVVGFKNRIAAEQALAKGHNIPDVGTVQISWFTNTSSAVTTETTTTPTHQQEEIVEAPVLLGGGRSPRHVDEEVVASGWGNDEEDGMGML
ncbi:hypothetical protein BDN72DRAFT_890677 [Pluteus cervinus]|uniref:Uncharacterized protein n=1 Tax=Pluteus cervinus TaxID=181527 RepID=A0ACD3BG65_9AGAR|nr:hypothetical protein BDN72DRAFT_890677 [Pluteus cervinus]